MFEDYFSFLDYRAARRRIQAKLAKPRWLALHILVFAAGFAVASDNFVFIYTPYYGNHYLLIAFTAWSVLLLGHALFSVVRSGLWPSRRTDLVEAEMRHLIQEHEDYETLRQQDLFEVHRQLENDITHHARPFIPLTLFAVVNAAIWLTDPWAAGPQPTPANLLTPILAFAVLSIYVLLVLVGSLFRSRSRPARRLETSSQTVEKYKGKRKPAEYLTLSDDGELVELHDEEWNAQNAQQS